MPGAAPGAAHSCEAEAYRRSDSLSLMSGAASLSGSGYALQARHCRRMGQHYFFAAGGTDDVALGSCLPASCVGAEGGEVRAAAGRVLGSDVQNVVAYTSFAVAKVGEVLAGESWAGRGDDGAPEPSTEWYSVDFYDLIGGALKYLPNGLSTARTLALTIRDFRGSIADYYRAVWAMVAFMGMIAQEGVTFIIAGIASMTTVLAEGFTVRIVGGLPFCGSSNWLPDEPEASLGVEVKLPPMWSLVVPRLFLQLSFRSDFGGLMPIACAPDIETHLHWSVPQDTLLMASALAQRGQCASAVGKRLPDLAQDSIFVPGNMSIPWAEVAEKLMHCTEQLDAALWEMRVDAAGWPSLLSDRLRYSKMLGGPDAQITAFICVPSRFAIELDEYHPGIQPEPYCKEPAVGLEAMPLLLAYHSGLYEVLSELEPPVFVDSRHGGRAPSALHEQLVEYHAYAVQHRQAMRGGVNIVRPTVAVMPTAAVCIAGRARSLALPDVYRSIAENVTGATLGTEASFFYVLDTDGRPLADFDEVFRELPPLALALVSGMNWGEPSRCEAYRRCGPACLYQFLKLRNCLNLIEAAEASRGRQFDWLLRLRPDTEWRAPIGNLADFDSSAVHFVVRSRGGDPEDNFALVPRAHAEAYFAVGDACPTRSETVKSRCSIPWLENAHITPECSIKTRLAILGVPTRSFPRIYRIRREDICRPGDPRGCGDCSIGVCTIKLDE